MAFYGTDQKRNKSEMHQGLPKQSASFLQGKCPRCRSGNVFKFPLARIFQFSKTNTHCPRCNLKFEAEPGFYWGAMYVSFGFSTGLLLLTAVLSTIYVWTIITTLMFVVIFTALCIPFMFRYSRLIMLYFISPPTHRFNPELIDKKKGK